MKILLVIPTVHGGGAEQVASILAREWAQAHSLRVLAWHVGPRQLDFSVPIEDLALPAQTGLVGKARMLLGRVRAISGTVHRWQPDVVLAFMDEAGIACALAALQGGWRQRLIVSMHHNPRWLGRSRRLLLSLLYRIPARVLGVSQGVKGEMAASLRLPAASLAQIPNPLQLRADAGDPAACAAAAACPSEFLLFVGRLERATKGLDLLLAAYARLSASAPALVIVGDGPDRVWLEGEVQRAGLGARVHLAGWQPDPLPFYRRARALLVCSRFEGWSNVLMEAMGAGCPVISTDCPYGPREILGEALAEWLSPVDDVAALAQNLMRLLALPAAAHAALGAAQRERVQRFAAPVVAEQWLALAREVIG